MSERGLARAVLLISKAARPGLVLQPSKKNPRVKRWMRVELGPSPPTSAVTPKSQTPATEAPTRLPEDVPDAQYLGKTVNMFTGMVNVSPKENLTLRRLLGKVGKDLKRKLTTIDLACLAGAHGEESVEVGRAIVCWGPNEDGTVIKITNTRYRATVMVDDQGIEVDLVEATNAGAGVGARLVAQQIATADQFGVKKLSLYAAGGPTDLTYNGYYTWARLGFSRSLGSATRSQLPPFLSGAASIADVMLTPGGPEWWKRNGWGFRGEFDLSPGSVSRRVLGKYLRAKGL